MHILGTKVCQSFWFKRQMNRVIARYNLLETSETKEKIWMSLSNVSFPQTHKSSFQTIYNTIDCLENWNQNKSTFWDGVVISHKRYAVWGCTFTFKCIHREEIEEGWQMKYRHTRFSAGWLCVNGHV